MSSWIPDFHGHFSRHRLEPNEGSTWRWEASRIGEVLLTIRWKNPSSISPRATPSLCCAHGHRLGRYQWLSPAPATCIGRTRIKWHCGYPEEYSRLQVLQFRCTAVRSKPWFQYGSLRDSPGLLRTQFFRREWRNSGFWRNPGCRSGCWLYIWLNCDWHVLPPQYILPVCSGRQNIAFSLVNNQHLPCQT